MSFRPDRMARTAMAVAAASVAVTLLYASQFRAGHVWGGDFALYAMHARNIVNGTAYAVTPFIPNPAVPAHSPAAFPPGYPTMLAPAWRLGGLDYSMLKLATLAWFPVLCVAYACLAAIFLTPAATVGFAVSLMLHPIFYAWRDFVGPEIPFSAFVGLFLCADARCRASGLIDRRPLPIGFLLGGLAFFAYAISTIGIGCLLALLARDLFNRRRLEPATIVAGITFGALALLGEHGLQAGAFTDVTRLVSGRPVWLGAHAEQLARTGLQIWTNGIPRLMAAAAALVLIALSARGIVKPREPAPAPATAIWYLAATLALGLLSGFPQIPNPIDLMMPLVPVVLLLTWRGASGIRLRRGLPLGFALLGIVLLVCYLAGFRAAPTGPITSGILQPCFTDLSRVIRTTTPPTARIAFWNPRVLALYTDRESFVPSDSLDAGAVWENLRALGATYLVVTRFAKEEAGILSSVVQQHAPEISLGYANDDYALYRVEPIGDPGSSGSPPTTGDGASLPLRPPAR